METMARLESAFAVLGGEYAARKSAAEEAVCTWQWATWCWFDVRPLYFERNGFTPGRTLKEEPPNRPNRVACGLDRDGRVVVERQFNPIGYYETFYDWAADGVEVAHFDCAVEKGAINLMRARATNDRVAVSDIAAIQGYTREEYRWEGGVIRGVEVYHARREGGVLAPLRPWHRARAHYRDDGTLQRVELIWPAAALQRAQDLVEIMFERRGKKIYRNRP